MTRLYFSSESEWEEVIKSGILPCFALLCVLLSLTSQLNFNIVLFLCRGQGCILTLYNISPKQTNQTNKHNMSRTKFKGSGVQVVAAAAEIEHDVIHKFKRTHTSEKRFGIKKSSRADSEAGAEGGVIHKYSRESELGIIKSSRADSEGGLNCRYKYHRKDKKKKKAKDEKCETIHEHNFARVESRTVGEDINMAESAKDKRKAKTKKNVKTFAEKGAKAKIDKSDWRWEWLCDKVSYLPTVLRASEIHADEWIVPDCERM